MRYALVALALLLSSCYAAPARADCITVGMDAAEAVQSVDGILWRRVVKTDDGDIAMSFYRGRAYVALFKDGCRFALKEVEPSMLAPHMTRDERSLLGVSV